MAEVSPLRQRMIEDMAIPTSRRRHNNRTSTRLPSSAATVAARQTRWGWRMCVLTNCI